MLPPPSVPSEYPKLKRMPEKDGILMCIKDLNEMGTVYKRGEKYRYEYLDKIYCENSVEIHVHYMSIFGVGIMSLDSAVYFNVAEHKYNQGKYLVNEFFIPIDEHRNNLISDTIE